MIISGNSFPSTAFPLILGSSPISVHNFPSPLSFSASSFPRLPLQLYIPFYLTLFLNLFIHFHLQFSTPFSFLDFLFTSIHAFLLLHFPGTSTCDFPPLFFLDFSCYLCSYFSTLSFDFSLLCPQFSIPLLYLPPFHHCTQLSIPIIRDPSSLSPYPLDSLPPLSYLRIFFLSLSPSRQRFPRQ